MWEKLLLTVGKPFKSSFDGKEGTYQAKIFLPYVCLYLTEKIMWASVIANLARVNIISHIQAMIMILFIVYKGAEKMPVRFYEVKGED